MIEIKTTTYGCLCGYHVDASLFENRDYFASLFPYVTYGTCPSCRTERLARLLDLSELSTHNTVEADDIDALTVVERDEDGNKVYVDSGEVKQEVGVVDGKPGIIETPIMVEKNRELTDGEKAEKLDQAQKAIDTLTELEHAE